MLECLLFMIILVWHIIYKREANVLWAKLCPRPQYVDAQTPSPQNVTAWGDGALKEVVKVKCSHGGAVGDRGCGSHPTQLLFL